MTMTADVVCIWWRPEFVKPGFYQGWLKRVAMAAPPWMKAYPYNDHPGSDVGGTLRATSSCWPAAPIL
jgi:hypothetical protein